MLELAVRKQRGHQHPFTPWEAEEPLCARTRGSLKGHILLEKKERFLCCVFGWCVARLVGVGSVPGAQIGCQGAAWSIAPAHTLGNQSGPLDMHTWAAARPYAAGKQDDSSFVFLGGLWLG